MKWQAFVFLLLVNNLAFAEQINLEKSTLGEFSKIVSDYLNKPVVIAADLKMPFSINGVFKDKEELKELFRKSVLASGLAYTEDNLSIMVSGKGQNVVDEVPQTTVSYSLKNSASSQVYESLKTANLKAVLVDSVANNAVVVTAAADVHKTVQQLILALDYSVKQVVIEAVISELSDKDYKGLDSKLDNYRNLDKAVNSLSNYSVVTPFAPLAEFGMKLISSKSLRFFLDWIQTSDTSSVLSKPKVVTLDRKQASIVVGQNVPFITGKSTGQASSTSTPFQTIERHDVGLKLQVTPTILPNGLVELAIVQESSSVNLDTTASDIVTNKRSVNSTALLRNGDTLLLGGLSSKTVSKGSTATIPDWLPWLTWFFSGNTENETNTNLVILITAKIVNVALPALPEIDK